MDWTKDKLPLIKDRQIIIATRDKKSKSYRYAVVFYHEPMRVWYGGPGIKVKPEDIEYWSEISAPASRDSV
jgi:hypothetical protein